MLRKHDKEIQKLPMHAAITSMSYTQNSMAVGVAVVPRRDGLGVLCGHKFNCVLCKKIFDISVQKTDISDFHLWFTCFHLCR